MDPYEQVFDERDFDEMMLVPEPPSGEIEGSRFSFLPREPPRPGQFTQLAMQSYPRNPKPIDSRSQEKTLLQLASISPPNNDSSCLRIPKEAPLDLPELCLFSQKIDEDFHPESRQIVPVAPNVNSKTKSTDSSSGIQSSPKIISGIDSYGESVDSDEKLSSYPFKPHGKSYQGEASQQPPSLSGKLSDFPPTRPSCNNFENIEKPVVVVASPKSVFSPVADQHVRLTQRHHKSNAAIRVEDHKHKHYSKFAHIHSIGHERQHSPTSTCGDLEGPTHRSPAMSSRHSREYNTNRIMPSHTPNAKEGLDNPRSHSRTSNISKKRTLTRKHHSRTETDRKKVAMHQVAQYWNECIQIAEEENMQASCEIERLHVDICRREEELRKSRTELDDKVNSLRKIETSYKELQEEDGQVVAQNKTLAHEVESLREQLSEAKKRGEALTEKYRAYRLKLNEAIKEQQELFLRSRTFYEDTMNQLRKDNASKSVDSLAINKALNESRKKREEIKKCIEEFRIETGKQIQNKEQTISELKERIHGYETSLMQEKELTDRLRTQIGESKSANQAVNDLESKVDALLACFNKTNDERQRHFEENSRDVEAIGCKLDAIIHENKLLYSEMISRGDLESKLCEIKDDVVACILPEILSVAKEHNTIGDAISRLHGAVTESIDGIQSRFTEQIVRGKEAREEAENQSQEVINLLESVAKNSKTTQQMCEKLGQRIDDSGEKRQAAEESAKQQLNNLTQQLIDRAARLTDFEHHLQAICESFVTKFEATKADSVKDGETTRNKLQLAIADLRGALDEGFKHEREITMKSICRNDETMAALITRIDQTNGQLDQFTKLRTNFTPDIQEWQVKLQDKQAVVDKLQERIRGFEENVKENTQLRQRWLQDIRAIDAMRTQLRGVQKQMPLVEGFGTKLDKIMELNGFIQSTASYLASEKDWVHKKLEGNSRPTSSHLPSTASLTESLLMPERAVTSLDSRYEIHSAGFRTAYTSSKKELPYRKVIVHSPAPHADSPSTPPSVQQEQRRRREVTQLRSILKPVTNYETVTNYGDGVSSPPRVNQSRYNRPVVGLFTGNGGRVANKVIAEIRSGLINEHDWTLPTVADFERSNPLTDERGRDNRNKRDFPLSDENIHGDLKRLRTEQNAI